MEEKNITLEIDMLNRVSNLVKEADERTRKQGDTYNIFHILNIKHAESIHTYVIHDLLNTKGSHGQGDLFLEQFICKFLPEEFPTKGVVTTREKYLGPVDYVKEKGGCMDIEISNKFNQAIFIENKINARDQLKQLKRYYNYGKDKYNSFKLFYLTLDGKCPIKESYCDLKKDEHFHCISYEKDILNWLQECKNIYESKPLLAATITQYINTIKTITGQSISPEMEKIKQEITKNIANYKAAQAISEVFTKINDDLKHKLDLIYIDLMSKFDESLKNSFFKFSGYEIHPYTIDIDLVKFKAVVEFGFEDMILYYGVSVERHDDEETSTIEGQLKQQLLRGEDDRRFSHDTEVNEISESLKKFIDDVIKILNENKINKISEN